MNQIITRNEELIVEAKIHLVFVNENGKPAKIPEKIYSKFKPYFCESIKT
jgi:acyl-CoA thioester hydrolase